MLSQNPGIAIDKAEFPWVGFKGGSEPGVMTLSWLLQRADGRWFAVSLFYADESAPIDDERALYHAMALVRLAADVP